MGVPDGFQGWAGHSDNTVSEPSIWLVVLYETEAVASADKFAEQALHSAVMHRQVWPVTPPRDLLRIALLGGKVCPEFCMI